MIQLVTLIDKSLDLARNVPTFRHQLIESSGITLLLLHQKTKSVRCKRDTDPLSDLAKDP